MSMLFRGEERLALLDESSFDHHWHHGKWKPLPGFEPYRELLEELGGILDDLERDDIDVTLEKELIDKQFELMEQVNQLGLEINGELGGRVRIWDFKIQGEYFEYKLL